MASILSRNNREQNFLVLNRRLFDYYDRRILEILLDNSRTPYTEIAHSLEISEGTVRNRIRRLRETGVIERFTIQVNGKGL